MVQIQLSQFYRYWMTSVHGIGRWIEVILSFCLLSRIPVALGNSLQCAPEVNEAIQQCVVPVAQYAEHLGMGGKSTPDSLIPQMSSNVFAELCRLINRFEVCVKEPRRKCPNHVTLSLIAASYGYLCNEGYSVFMQNADCLMRLDQESRVRKCHETTMLAIKDANNRQDIDVERKMNDMCRQLNYFTRCVHEPVQNECGINAWGVILRVLKDTTQTLMPTCSLAAEFVIPPQFLPNDKMANKGAYDNSPYQKDEPTATNNFHKLDPERVTSDNSASRSKKFSIVIAITVLSTVVRWL